MTEYKCIADHQTGEWCVGEVDTTDGWADRAIGWTESDGLDEIRAELIKGQEQIKSEQDEQALMDFIAEIWQIEFEKVKGE